MSSPVKYYTFSQVQLDTVDGVQEGGDTQNPLFNFPQGFFQKLQGVSANELGRSVPYISLHTIDLNGEIMEDMNLKFFFRPIDVQNIHQQVQRGERPIMSLKDVSLKTTLASGYLYYTDVTLTLVVHSTSVLSQSTITSLIFPGMPHLLEYGWSSPNEFLNASKERLLFQVVTYDLNVSEKGEVTLVVRGKAFNDAFNNTYVGDNGDLIESDLINNAEADGINHNKQRIEKYVEYLKSTKTTGGKQSSDYDIARQAAVVYKTVEKKARGKISKEFLRRRTQLQDLAKDGIVTLHDVIYTLCGDTFKALTESWPRASEFRFVYGDINETIRGTKIPKNLAEFPIDLDLLNNRIKKEIKKGQIVITVQKMLNMLAKDFVENEELWKDQISQTDAEFYNKPEIVINFTNRNGGTNRSVMEVIFHDAKQGIPATTSRLPKGKAPTEEAKKKVIEGTNLPVLKLGNANSFIRNLNLSQITNQAMRAVFLQRMSKDRLTTVRSAQPQSTALKAVPTSPLTLPLRGSIEVLGHPDWKVFRSLYLDASIFLIDGVYKIMEVEHVLNKDGYITRMVLLYN